MNQNNKKLRELRREKSNHIFLSFFVFFCVCLLSLSSFCIWLLILICWIISIAKINPSTPDMSSKKWTNFLLNCILISLFVAQVVLFFFFFFFWGGGEIWQWAQFTFSEKKTFWKCFYAQIDFFLFSQVFFRSGVWTLVGSNFQKFVLFFEIMKHFVIVFLIPQKKKWKLFLFFSLSEENIA